VSDVWDPGQYARFRDERAQPFFDLLGLVRPVPGGRIVDLGCGPGELTAILAERTGAAETVGLDSSTAMLAEAAAHAKPGLRFEEGDIGTWRGGRFDVVFSNAALQWVDGHETLFERLTRDLLAPGGQLAVQMPANHDHPSHLLAHALAGEEPFRSALGGYVRAVPVLPVEWYAAELFRLGFREQRAFMNVYPHVLADAGAVVEWVKGTLLTDYRKRLPEALYEQYLAEYRRRWLALAGDARPFFYPFKRILLWAA
jgi:trans-aconitate 2-methyltransferase